MVLMREHRDTHDRRGAGYGRGERGWGGEMSRRSGQAHGDSRYMTIVTGPSAQGSGVF
jgi:hypothetical protein